MDISHGGKPENFFAGVLKLWGTGNYAAYNWCTMLNVLNTPTINKEILAKDITHKLQTNKESKKH